MAYFIHLVADINQIFEPLPPLQVRIIITDVLVGVYGES